jgi:hypothetical protein
MTQYEIEKLWVRGKLANVAHSFDDTVRLKTGKRAGEIGRVVALFAIEPKPHYIIEFSDGLSENVVEGNIEVAESIDF